MTLRNRLHAKAIAAVPALDRRVRKCADRVTLAGSLGDAARATTPVVLPLYSPTGLAEQLKGLGPEDAMAAGILAQVRLAAMGGRIVWDPPERDVVRRVARRTLPWAADDVALLFDTAFRVGDDWSLIPLLVLPVAAAERCDDPSIAVIATEVISRLDQLKHATGSDRAKVRARLSALTPSKATEQDALAGDLLAADDNWGPVVLRQMAALPSQVGIAALIEHLEAATTGVSPTKKWSDRCKRLLEEAPSGREAVRVMLAAVPATEETRAFNHAYSFEFAQLLSPRNSYVVRGAVWAAGLLGEPWLASVLGDVAMACAVNPRGGNSTRDDKVANAAIAQLGAAGTDDAVAALARLKAMVTNRAALTQVERAAEAASAATGRSTGELFETAVPRHDLGRDGTLDVAVGNAKATIAIVAGKATVTWRSGSGKVVRSVPKEVREDHAGAVASVRAATKEIDKTLAAERSRLEGLFAQTGRSWPVEVWRERYLDHPVTSALARDLIWTVGGGDGASFVVDDSGHAVDAAGERIDLARLGNATVELWHPIAAPDAQVVAWRDAVTTRRIRQPFKQAFREVYLRTPAEDETERYSNRFAGHILRYQQAYALMRARRWSGNYLGYWDGGFEGVARRSFEDTGYRAEFSFDLVEAPDDGREVVQLCSTDQVRFSRRDGRAWAEVSLVDVPARVFSEAMRDVDLFVGVTSIAGDPNWEDRGDNRYAGYWTTTSFGDLTESAITRREALRRIVPMLKIANRCTLEERFLVVRGTCRTYKIHYGSGNVLMSPRDEYLCIVPKRGASKRDDGLFLPFEEDGTLSIILSKATLLAADDRIDDRSIRKQIARNN